VYEYLSGLGFSRQPSCVLGSGRWVVTFQKNILSTHHITSADSDNFFWVLVSAFQKTQCYNTGNQNISWVEADRSVLLWLQLIWHKLLTQPPYHVQFPNYLPCHFGHFNKLLDINHTFCCPKLQKWQMCTAFLWWLPKLVVKTVPVPCVWQLHS
jgi:hypothetical protein